MTAYDRWKTATPYDDSEPLCAECGHYDEDHQDEDAKDGPCGGSEDCKCDGYKVRRGEDDFDEFD